jgi:hypothetical protein
MKVCNFVARIPYAAKSPSICSLPRAIAYYKPIVISAVWKWAASLGREFGVLKIEAIAYTHINLRIIHHNIAMSITAITALTFTHSNQYP